MKELKHSNVKEEEPSETKMSCSEYEGMKTRSAT
jgi:hypothetical protein